jgi:hypothetical protein
MEHLDSLSSVIPLSRYGRHALVFASILSLASLISSRADAQPSDACRTDRTLSTLVGAGLGGAAGAIPATIVHRHDQASSHRIVAVSISAGALIGFVAAGRDHPCLSRMDSSRLADAVVATRSGHARHGALAGAVIGGVLGAVGGTFYNVGCGRDPCDATRTRVNIMLFSAGEGALAGGILGSLIGWAWPAGRQ